MNPENPSNWNPELESTQRTETENNNENWEKNISDDLNSEKFITLLEVISPEDRGKAIGMALQYRITNPSDEDFWKYIEELPRSFGFKSELGNQIISKLGITDLGNVDNKRKIFREYIKAYNEQGFVFHGFNGVFEHDIREHGLDTEKRHWDWTELQRITEIGAKTGHKMILGWGTINSEAKIFFDRSAQHTYRYATASPEWFAQFVSEGFHVANDPKKKQAYYRRDYPQAKQNIIDLCDRMMSSKPEDIQAGKAYPNITEAERQEILDFFEKYWPLLTSDESQPKVALIKRSALPQLAVPNENLDDFCKAWDKTAEEVDIKWALNTLEELEHMGIDHRVAQNIPPNDIKIISLPDYNTVNPAN